MRNGAVFLLGHALFRGNEVLWIVLAALFGVVVGVAGMWLYREAHHGPLLPALTRPGGLLRLRSSARAHRARRTARP
jgi:hypothetical protein